VVAAVDADHLDVYGTYGELKKTFVEFTKNLGSDGILVVNENYADLFENGRKVVYGMSNAKYKAVEVSVKDFKFSLEVDGKVELEGIKLKVAGVHNVENAVAAAAVAMEAGISAKQVKKGLESFAGNWRRFDVLYNDGKVVYIDDYAHHPREIEAVLNSVKEIWQGKKITVVFQPHLYSRTKDFADDFAEVLSLADEVVLLPVYPARELPLPGITSEWLASKIVKDVSVVEKSMLVDFLRDGDYEVILTLGAGDIDREVKRIKEMLEEKYAK
jgi:UDP-N-acetylmuramate--alanine ligase